MSKKVNIQVAPSLLAANLARLGDECAAVERDGADMIHYDVMDGHFVPNITMGWGIMESLREHTTLPIDVHLMIERPERYVADFRKAGGDILTIHIEATHHVQRVLSQIRALGAKAGLAFNPGTSLADVEYLLGDVDMLLMMTVNPGFGGQSFLEQVLPKIRKARQMIDESGHDVMLEVDGGIDPLTARRCLEAGADVLVAGTAIYRRPSYRDAIASIRSGTAESSPSA
ncbi:MAG: ribulose-phosphate 3-epimerase [Proteobacteria bacterium]|nr:ribulose-phosphate 3-epimerase [Pseudomonadota bacterium]